MVGSYGSKVLEYSIHCMTAEDYSATVKHYQELIEYEKTTEHGVCYVYREHNLGKLFSFKLTDTQTQQVLLSYRHPDYDAYKFHYSESPSVITPYLPVKLDCLQHPETQNVLKKKLREARRWINGHGDIIIVPGGSVPECLERAQNYYGISFLERDQSKDLVGYLTEDLEFVPYKDQSHPEEES